MNPSFSIPVTPEKLAAAKTELAKQGIKIDGNVGAISHDGVHIGYSYDGANLTMTVISIGWVARAAGIDEPALEAKARAWFAA